MNAAGLVRGIRSNDTRLLAGIKGVECPDLMEERIVRCPWFAAFALLRSAPLLLALLLLLLLAVFSLSLLAPASLSLCTFSFLALLELSLAFLGLPSLAGAGWDSQELLSRSLFRGGSALLGLVDARGADLREAEEPGTGGAGGKPVELRISVNGVTGRGEA